MVESDGTFAGNAAREIKEELELEEDINVEDLINLTELTYGLISDAKGEEILGEGLNEELPKGMWPSAGGCDEYQQIFMCEKKIDREKLDGLKGKLTGLREEGELITLRLVKLEELWWRGVGDGKVLVCSPFFSPSLLIL